MSIAAARVENETDKRTENQKGTGYTRVIWGLISGDEGILVTKPL